MDNTVQVLRQHLELIRKIELALEQKNYQQIMELMELMDGKSSTISNINLDIEQPKIEIVGNFNYESLYLGQIQIEFNNLADLLDEAIASVIGLIDEAIQQSSKI
jgi:hypothetical protein